MQTLDTISQRSLLSCAPGPAGSPGSSPHAGPCISAAASAGAASPRGTSSLPAAASCSRRPGPSPSAAASSPPGRSLWPSGVKTVSVSSFPGPSAHLGCRAGQAASAWPSICRGCSGFASGYKKYRDILLGLPSKPGLCSEH